MLAMVVLLCDRRAGVLRPGQCADWRRFPPAIGIEHNVAARAGRDRTRIQWPVHRSKNRASIL